MGELRSALDALRCRDLRGLDDEGLEEDFAELERARNVLEVEQARRLAEIERRGTYRREGFLAPAAWLVRRFQIAWSVATDLVRWARALEQMPATREALTAGDVGRSAARCLVAAREACPDAFGDAEASLVEAARTLDLPDLRVALRYWADAAAPEGAEDLARHRHAVRQLYVSPTLDGMVRVDGDLDPETGQTLITALRSVEDAEVRSATPEDRRTAAQRRADALGVICRSWLDRSDRPTVAGERPHLTVTVDLEALEGRVGARCEAEDVGPVMPEAARRIACDASVGRVITRGRSEPLDVGRRTPVVPPGLRRAVVHRDRRCRFPGCERPASWCDAHHVVHWADGGCTALSNLVLLCRRHHRLVHEDGFGLAMDHGRPVFSRPDGTPLEDRAPPLRRDPVTRTPSSTSKPLASPRRTTSPLTPTLIWA